jgi:hypothetical protein
VQFAAAVSVLTVPAAVLSTQDWFRQPWPVPRKRQRAVPAALVALLLPAHRPSRPQVLGLVAATQAVAGSGSVAPAATAVQVPIEPAMRQDSQVPLQAELQQTPGVPSVR